MQEPIARHRAQAAEVVTSGDAEAIKRLYVDLGGYFADAYAADLEIPVLSAPETAPVVCHLFGTTPGRFLDAGCGPVPAASLLLARERSRTVVALDLGLGTVRVALALAGRDGVRLLGVVGDVEALPFRRGAFDGVVCDDTIEHLPDDRTGVAELVRVLDAAGRVVIATP